MNNYALKLITAPTVEPVTTTEAKAHLAIDDSTFDTQIDSFISTARQVVENHTSRQINTATWELVTDAFPRIPTSKLALPKGELQTVDSVKYTDADGNEQTLASSEYQVSDSREPAVIQPAYTKSWPTTRVELDAVRIRFTCGYGDASDVPEPIKQAILLLVGHYFEHRESVLVNATPQVLPMAVDSLIAQYYLGDQFTWYAPAN